MYPDILHDVHNVLNQLSYMMSLISLATSEDFSIDCVFLSQVFIESKSIQPWQIGGSMGQALALEILRFWVAKHSNQFNIWPLDN